MRLPQPISADLNRGWVDQYFRMTRWKERILPLAKVTKGKESRPLEVLDFALAYFICAHSLRDWLIESGAVERKNLDEFLESKKAWHLCRDVCNRSMHYYLNRNPTDSGWSLLRSNDHYTQRTSWLLRYDHTRMCLSDAVQSVQSMWQEAIALYSIERQLNEGGGDAA